MNRFYRIYLFLALITICAGGPLHAQQDPQYSLNMFNQMAINPGYAGSQGMLNASVINRQQWMGFEGNPKTTMASVHMPITPFGLPSGVGLTFMDDQLGFEKNMAINLNYAYRMGVAGGSLGIGLSGGLLSKSLDAKWTIPDSDIHIPATQDPAIPDGTEAGMAFDMGLGVFYQGENFYSGLSTTHLFQPRVDYGMSAKVDMKRHYYFSAGYTIKLANPLLEVEPSLFAKYDGSSVQVDVNARVIYNKLFWGGVTYRLGDAMVVMGGLELSSGLRVGVAYDFTTSAIGAYSYGSVEFMLSYSLEVSADKLSQKYRSVRFL